ncbi:MAG TPA: DUF177 domain-containing protein [Candidatus Krumholzibacterium sp.]|nr:DUF177 domain-containing protein [Candidatus Krumholzibacterium sp.]
MKPNQEGREDLKIRISGLSAGPHEYSLSVAPSDIQLDQNFNAPVKVDVRLEKTPRQIYLQTRISTSGQFQCDRCLSEFRQQISTRYSIVYIFDESDAGQFPPEEVRIVHQDLPVIDLSEDVREMIVLSVPLKLLCREECRGLCSSCGKDLNAGACGCPRDAQKATWRGLEKLLKN